MMRALARRCMSLDGVSLDDHEGKLLKTDAVSDNCARLRSCWRNRTMQYQAGMKTLLWLLAIARVCGCQWCREPFTVILDYILDSHGCILIENSGQSNL